ncbi:RagB/SusD family nutrient uptake outer membrane protein [Telluribacter sp. SYSU D00476]|uniref:RagB/SusD family nutrient uptake outer membrane protein n=1 Tax=Telluribacter sp. SYSU D00476 TaxID=2811430 RepID=UPI001FF54636|nr:RagB/SusD family nutrient uptake outer membrane protein [Telluribacter sp. SYSU D00476]
MTILAKHTIYSSLTRARKAFPLLAALLLLATSCREVLQPDPVDLLVDELVLNEASDVQPVRLGLYNAFRGMGAPMVIAGDFTADYIQHNGTFTLYNELGNKQITAANAAAEALWGAIYNTVYLANFIEERIGSVPGVTEATRKQVLAEARLLRGFAYFVGVHTYGGIPRVTTTDIATNRNIPRASREDILQAVLADYQAALPDLPETYGDRVTSKTFATKNAARAALARYYLYQQDWTKAEQSATEVISSGRQTLPAAFADVISTEYDDETILEVAYANNSSDDPGTSTFGLNNILVGRREVIPSNKIIQELISNAAGERRQTISFNSTQQRGNDNGWTVRKYGAPDDANNNIHIFRLAEMYLIRAEARARLGRLTGNNGAQADINVLRTRAKAPAVTLTTQEQALTTIENERLYELAFEGHRWFDLKRTGRLDPVMSAFSPNWNTKFQLWPIPQSEIQRNQALRGSQNPGY